MLPDEALDRPLEPRAVGGERRRRRTRADADDRGPIGRLQVVDERVHGAADAERAAEPDVRLIDDEQDQAPPVAFSLPV